MTNVYICVNVDMLLHHSNFQKSLKDAASSIWCSLWGVESLVAISGEGFLMEIHLRKHWKRAVLLVIIHCLHIEVIPVGTYNVVVPRPAKVYGETDRYAEVGHIHVVNESKHIGKQFHLSFYFIIIYEIHARNNYLLDDISVRIGELLLVIISSCIVNFHHVLLLLLLSWWWWLKIVSKWWLL